MIYVNNIWNWWVGDNWPSRPEKAKTWASIPIKLTANKMIALMATQILKGTGSSENISVGWNENRANDYKYLKRAFKSIYRFLIPNSHETSSELQQKAGDSLWENLKQTEWLWTWAHQEHFESRGDTSLLTERWEPPSKSLFLLPRILAAMLTLVESQLAIEEFLSDESDWLQDKRLSQKGLILS